MIFFMLPFVLPFAFIRSFSLAEQTKANSFWIALKVFTQDIFCCLSYSSACSKQNFVSFMMSWALSTSYNLSRAFAFLTSFVQIVIILYIHSFVLVMSFEDLSLNRVEDSFYLETTLFLLHWDCLQFQRQIVHTWTSPTLVRHLPLQNCKTTESLLWIFFPPWLIEAIFNFSPF